MNDRTSSAGASSAGGTAQHPLVRRIRAAGRALGRPEPWRRGLVLAAAALLLGLLLLLHGWVPNAVGNLGSLVETFLPWFGLLVVPLAAGAVWRRSASAVAALLLPVVAWACLFGGTLVGGPSGGGGSGDLTVVSQNVDAGNHDPAATARALAARGADLLALEELTPQATTVYERELAGAYRYHVVRGTVGLWSRLPLSGTTMIDVVDYGPLGARKSAAAKLPANRALRTTVATGHGPVAVYVAHLGSVRVRPNPRGIFETGSRDIGLRALGAAVAADRSARVVLAGDLNGTTDDRAFDVLTSRLRSVQSEAGAGFGFTWPAGFPVARIDHILIRGLTAADSDVLGSTGSDHRPVEARLAW